MKTLVKSNPVSLRNANCSPRSLHQSLKFDDPFLRNFFSDFSDVSGKSHASANIIETDDEFQLELLVPGYAKKDISLQLDQDELKISGEVKQREGVVWKRREFVIDSFSRTFKVAVDKVDVSKIEATCKQGILVVTLPKSEAAKPKPVQQIEVK